MRDGSRLSRGALLPTDLPGDRTAAWIGALLLSLVYVGIIPVHAYLLTGDARVVMIALAATFALACAAVALAVPHLPDRTIRVLLVLLFVIPVVHTEAQLAVTRELEQTALLMLITVAVGALTVSRRVLLGLLVATDVGWVAVVLIREPKPADQVTHYALQLVLAGVLAIGVFAIRSRVVGRLQGAHERLSAQRDELAELRAQAAADLVRLRRLVNASPVGLALSDEHGRLVQVNRAMCKIVGMREAELLGHGAELFTHPDDLEFLPAAGPTIESSPHGVANVETRYVRSNGAVIWVWLTLTHVAGPAGEEYTLAHVQDITDRRLADERLRQSNEVIEAARLVAHAVQLGEDPRQVIVDKTRQIADADSVQFIEMLDADHLVITTSSGDPDLTGTRIGLRETSMTGHVWRSGETVFVDKAADHPLASPRLLEQTNARSTMWAPAMVEGKVVAVISLVWSQVREEVTELQRTGVDTLVAETALALMSERMRHSLEEWSTTDPLTGLLNRRGWEAQVAELDADRRRERWPTTIALLDFDHFKAYNDTYGHSAGDIALSSFGTSISGARRTKDVVARWGGEEFAIALPNCDATAAEGALQRLVACVPPELTCSVGYTVLTPGEEIGGAIRRADRALYVAKDAGRDQIRGDTEPVAKPSY